MMALHCFEILLFLSAVLPQHESLFSRHPSSDHFHVHLEDDDDHLILPKHTSTIKIVHPVTSHDKFYPILKKHHQPKFVKPSVFGKISLADTLKLTTTDGEKNVEKEVVDLFRRPVSVAPITIDDFNSLYSPKQIHTDPQFEDVKPVTEIIEGDLKYDFRTKTHSI